MFNLIGLFILVSGILSIIFMALCDIFNFSSKKDYPKLSYKQFTDYYWINPDKWILCDNYVQYKYLKDIRNIYYNYNTKSFSFSFIDQFKYQKFKHYIKTNKEKMRQSKAHNESYQILLEGVQEDIDKLRQQSKYELDQVVGTIKEVKERIG